MYAIMTGKSGRSYVYDACAHYFLQTPLQSEEELASLSAALREAWSETSRLGGPVTPSGRRSSGPRNLPTERRLPFAKAYLAVASAIRAGRMRPPEDAVLEPGLTLDQIRSRHEHHVRHITLQVTRQCNLRCSYCINSGAYRDAPRHAAEAMSAATARAAVDYYAAHSQGEPQATICFYGGEPLLEADLIRDTIAYAHRVLGDRRQAYRITTNGTLVDPPFVDWFAEHEDCYLTITLDGPPQQHDAHRKHPSGRGSHTETMEALQALRERSPAAFRQRVHIQCDFLTWFDVPPLHGFMAENPWLGDQVASVNGVMRHDDTGPIAELRRLRTNLESPRRSETEVVDELLTLWQRALRERPPGDPLLNHIFDAQFLPWFGMRPSAPGQPVALAGLCIPLSTRLFVGTDGSFNLCERVHPFWAYGNPWEGVDWAGVGRMLDIHTGLNCTECSRCWLYRACTQCYSSTFRPNGVDLERRAALCETARRDAAFWFYRYIELARNAPECLSHLAGYT